MSQDALQRLNQLPLRENLRGLSPYGAPQIGVPVQLNVNENTHPLPQEVIDEITTSVQAAARTLNTSDADSPQKTCGRPTDPTKSSNRSCKPSAGRAEPS